MLGVAKAHPANDDIALLAAEAAMDTRPWDYWTVDKQPNPRMADAVKLVETVYARNPDHPQAAHLYIHLMENGPDPKRAEAAADKLATPLSPEAGHLVHMPAHIYYRLGRWQDSMRVNVAAARADEAWIKATGDRGMVRYGYYPHNVHFIVTSAQMAGDMPTAMREFEEACRHPRPHDQFANRVDRGGQRRALFHRRAIRRAGADPGDEGARRAAALPDRDAALCARRGFRPAAQPRRFRARARRDARYPRRLCT